MKKHTTPTAADRTERPALWIASYWAPCRDERLVPDTIIRNRDAFARERRLTKPSRITLPPFSIFGADYELDHLELYRDADGAVVCVCSNYGDTPPPPALGMTETPPLYVIGARSYAARFDTVPMLRAAFKAVTKHTQGGSSC